MAIEMRAFPERKGMGTTLTMAYLIWPRMYLVHVGDSRCYLFRDGTLRQLTRDHTVAEMCAEQGEMEAEEAESSRLSNVLWNFVGGDSDDLSPEVHRAELRRNDSLLLCTDGLTKCVEDAQIAERLAGGEPSDVVCQQLVSDAINEGAPDNTTVVVARLVSSESPFEEQKAAAETGQTGRIETPVDTGPDRPVPETTVG
jgi:protein phosphatase